MPNGRIKKERERKSMQWLACHMWFHDFHRRRCGGGKASWISTLNTFALFIKSQRKEADGKMEINLWKARNQKKGQKLIYKQHDKSFQLAYLFLFFLLKSWWCLTYLYLICLQWERESSRIYADFLLFVLCKCQDIVPSPWFFVFFFFFIFISFLEKSSDQ